MTTEKHYSTYYNNEDKKVVLINTPCYKILDDNIEPPIGLLYIQSFLLDEGINCELYDMAINKNTIENIPKADIYGFSTYTNNFYTSCNTAKYLKDKYPESTTVAGGYHVSSVIYDGFKNFDITVVGEGEKAMRSIVVDTHHYKNFDQVIYGECFNYLDDLPYPRYDKIDINDYTREVDGNKVLSVVCSRGCQFACRFCNSIISKMYHVRSRSTENILSEVDVIKDEHNIKYIKFNDDNFLDCVDDPKGVAKGMLERDVKYRCMVRAKSLTVDNAQMLGDTGCYYLSIGIESMSDKMLKLMNKKTTVEDNIKAILNADKVGLKLRLFLLVGFPGETDNDIEQTIKILKDMKYDSIGIYAFVPYHGTDVQKHPDKYNAVINPNYDGYISVDSGTDGSYLLSTDKFTIEDVKRRHDRMREELLLQHKWSMN